MLVEQKSSRRATYRFLSLKYVLIFFVCGNVFFWAPFFTRPRRVESQCLGKTSASRADTTSVGEGDRLPAYLEPVRLRERSAHKAEGRTRLRGNRLENPLREAAGVESPP